MKILMGKVGSGKSHFFGEGITFDAEDDKELEEYIEASRSLGRVLINVWHVPNIELFNVKTKAYIELHEDVNLKEHITKVKYFEIPTKDEMEETLNVKLPDSIKNWWDAIHYVKYDVEPIENKIEHNEKYYIGKLGFRYNKLKSNKDIWQYIEECLI